MNGEYSFLKSTKPPVSKPIGKSVKVQWYGLNHNANADSGYIVDGRNFYVTADGTLRAIDVPEQFDGVHPGTPLAFYGIDGKLFYVYCREYSEDNKTKYNVDIIRYDDLSDSDKFEVANLTNNSTFFDAERSLARYNAWASGSDVINGEYKSRLIIYPDKEWLSFDDAWNTPSAITRYKIIKQTKVKKRVSQKTYNSMLESGTPEKKGEWIYNSSEDKYYVSSSADGEGWFDETNTSEEVYGYADEKYKIDGSTETKPEVNYNVEQAGRPDGTTFQMLTVETTDTTTSVTYEFKKDESSAVPNAENITPWNNRIFGVNGSKIFASAAGSYVDYDLDTATDFDGNNAWYSTTQAGGDFTHICTYGGRPVAFKADMLYEVYGDSNPFRIKGISRTGAFNGASVHEVDSVLFYANKDGIYTYGGSHPRSISEGYIDKKKLRNGLFTGCSAGTYDGKYFVRVPHITSEETVTVTDGENRHTYKYPILVFDTSTGSWSVVSAFDNDVSYFAEADGKFYAVLDNGVIYLMNSGNKGGMHWYFETPVITGGTADSKVLEKIQMLAKFHGEGSIRVSVKYDNGAFEEVGRIDTDSGIHPLYSKISKGDHIARFIRFDCVGDVEILSFEQLLSEGGARNG